jgi:hypothetical protein
MKQYAIGFISAIMLFLIGAVLVGFTPAPNIGMTGRYQLDTLLMKQEDFLGNKSYEVLYTIYDTTTGDIKQTRRVPHSNYIAKKIQRQKSAFDYK